MEKLYVIPLILMALLCAFLASYAFVPQVKAFVDQKVMPPVQSAFGGLITAITSSVIWKQYIIPFPNQLIIGMVLLGFPIAWLFHKSFNKVRATFVRSAQRETGQVIMTEPITTVSQPAQPTPTTTEEKKQQPVATQTEEAAG